jgi:hypothetical protein
LCRRSHSRAGAATVGLALAASIPAGCVDYVNHRDSITLAAGDAVHWNQAVHTVEHLPTAAYATHIDSDGKRIAVVYDQWWRRPPPPQPVVNVTVNTSD